MDARWSEGGLRILDPKSPACLLSTLEAEDVGNRLSVIVFYWMGRPPSQLWRGGGGLVLVNGFDYVRRSLTTSFNKKVSGTETFIFYCVCTHCTTLCTVSFEKSFSTGIRCVAGGRPSHSRNPGVRSFAGSSILKIDSR